jgi:hypothetical protein
LEHHTLRDEQWREKTEQLFNAARRTGHVVTTAAEFAGQENSFLESKRKQLYRSDPPSQEFKKWMHDGTNAKGTIKPPI